MNIRTSVSHVALSLCVMVTFSIRTANATVATQASFAPPDGRVLLFIGQDRDSINEYVRATGTVPAGFMVYTSIQDLHGLTQPVEYGAGVIHAEALMKRYPQTVLQIGLWMVGAVYDIPQGRYDAQIDRLATWLINAHRPIYLRVGYEFDLPENQYQPTAYVRSYRYLVNRLRQRNVRNVAYVWHSFAADNSTPLTAWYPGDDYVDWCAVTLFNQGWGDLDPMATFARDHHKPLMIAEATPRGIGTTNERAWKKWFDDCASFIVSANVKAFCYINADWETLQMFRGQGWGDSRVQVNQAVRQDWLMTIGTARYLHASGELYREVGYSS